MDRDGRGTTTTVSIEDRPAIAWYAVVLQDARRKRRCRCRRNTAARALEERRDLTGRCRRESGQGIDGSV